MDLENRTIRLLVLGKTEMETGILFKRREYSVWGQIISQVETPSEGRELVNLTEYLVSAEQYRDLQVENIYDIAFAQNGSKHFFLVEEAKEN